MRQLLTGLHYCHVNQVLHRDIKGSYLHINFPMFNIIILSLTMKSKVRLCLLFAASSNLLIDNGVALCFADFGLPFSPPFASVKHFGKPIFVSLLNTIQFFLLYLYVSLAVSLFKYEVSISVFLCMIDNNSLKFR